ncbi:macrophage mannose receptor 1 [Perca flavescens]|uniref:macrophage mannose receptor 1 n=1 Tax=Perca flavescens TaxID=8167 RepID=UPI00106DF439|nr:macrophage mannose receptor 1-like [Perca flavescens]
MHRIQDSGSVSFQCSSIGGHLYDYHFIGEKKTWKEAQEYCRKNHTDLATVSNQTDMKRLMHEQHEGGAWIGLQNNTPNTVWRWSLSGVEFNETESDWFGQQPDIKGCVDKDHHEICVRLRGGTWDDDSCSTKNKFICYDENKKSGKTFYISDDKITWLEAQSYCREHCTDLISGVKQLDEFEQQHPNHAENFWIGLFRDCWSWSDGSSFSFRSWDKDEPKKTCAMTTSNGKWSSDNCGERKPFFCYNNSVILINQSMIWEDALYYCRDHYRDLVSITNQDDQRWVQERAKMASTPHVWLGLRYTCTLDFWFWVSDETVHYKNWGPSQPGDDCNMSGAMDREGTWVKKIDDDHQLNFICSKNKPAECQCSSIGGHLYDYHFIGEKKTWKEAQEYCRKNHNSTTEQYPDGAWIGLQRDWRWSLPGVEFNKSKWFVGQPDNGGNHENCVWMKMKKGYIWNDYSCSKRYKFICYDEHKKPSKNVYIIKSKKMNWTDAQRFCREHHTDLISGVKQLEDFKRQRQNYAKKHPKDDNPFWIGLFRDSYWNSVILINQSMTWEDALNYCRDHHGDLVSITNQDDQRWVQERAKMASTPHVWLGLRYTCTLDFWFWVSDETVLYKNWSPGQPGDECNMSGAMDREGTWVKKIDDDHQLNFICSKNKPPKCN